MMKWFPTLEVEEINETNKKNRMKELITIKFISKLDVTKKREQVFEANRSIKLNKVENSKQRLKIILLNY